jgi:hypothetical protein
MIKTKFDSLSSPYCLSRFILSQLLIAMSIINETTSIVENVIPSSMKISAIKMELESYGIPTSSFIEKSELITAIEKARVAVDEDTIDSMSISAIRKELEQNCGISTNTYIERTEFISTLEKARADGVRRKCKHGFSAAFPPERNVLAIYNHLIETIHRTKNTHPADSVGMNAMLLLLVRFSKILATDDNLLSKLKEYMIVAGTDIFLEGEPGYNARGVDPRGSKVHHLCLAKFLAQAISGIEHKDLAEGEGSKNYKETLENLEKETIAFSKKIRDLAHDGERSVTRFFAKRISCNCLKDKYDRVKHQIKMGECFGCGKKMGFNNLLYCTRCSVVNYCSKKCQVEHWPRHKGKCKAATANITLDGMVAGLGAGNF